MSPWSGSFGAGRSGQGRGRAWAGDLVEADFDARPAEDRPDLATPSTLQCSRWIWTIGR